MNKNDDKILQLDKTFPEEEIQSDSEFAFWDEFYSAKKGPFEIEEFEDGTRVKVEIPLKKIKTN